MPRPNRHTLLFIWTVDDLRLIDDYYKLWFCVIFAGLRMFSCLN
jgi:hypothetical protein